MRAGMRLADRDGVQRAPPAEGAGGNEPFAMDGQAQMRARKLDIPAQDKVSCSAFQSDGPNEKSGNRRPRQCPRRIDQKPTHIAGATQAMASDQVGNDRTGHHTAHVQGQDYGMLPGSTHRGGDNPGLNFRRNRCQACRHRRISDKWIKAHPRHPMWGLPKIEAGPVPRPAILSSARICV